MHTRPLSARGRAPPHPSRSLSPSCARAAFTHAAYGFALLKFQLSSEKRDYFLAPLRDTAAAAGSAACYDAPGSDWSPKPGPFVVRPKPSPATPAWAAGHFSGSAAGGLGGCSACASDANGGQGFGPAGPGRRWAPPPQRTSSSLSARQAERSFRQYPDASAVTPRPGSLSVLSPRGLRAYTTQSGCGSSGGSGGGSGSGSGGGGGGFGDQLAHDATASAPCSSAAIMAASAAAPMRVEPDAHGAAAAAVGQIAALAAQLQGYVTAGGGSSSGISGSGSSSEGGGGGAVAALPSTPRLCSPRLSSPAHRPLPPISDSDASLSDDPEPVIADGGGGGGGLSAQVPRVPPLRLLPGDNGGVV